MAAQQVAFGLRVAGSGVPSSTSVMTSVPPESIELAVGLLGRIREADAEALAQAIAASFDHLRPWMPWATEAGRRLDAQRTYCRESEAEWDEGSDYIWLLWPLGDDAVAGSFGLHRRVGPGAIEIGYWVHADYVRRGYATAGAYALTAAALQLDDVERVLILTDEKNAASAAIPRRLGYRLDDVEIRPPEAPAESGRLQVWTWPATATGS
jgi:RimJ/RimL family protein N-acetyltransferase